MGPSLSAVQHATELFADPAVRAQLRQWHREQMPLMEMVDRLGFTDLFDDKLRTVVVNLAPHEVAIIRDVMLAEIDNAAASTKSVMPIACDIVDVPSSVVVTSEQNAAGRPVARVRPA